MADEIKYSTLGDLRASHILHRLVSELLHDPTDLRAVMTEMPWEGGSSVQKHGQIDLDIAMTAPGQVTAATNTALTDGSFSLTVDHYTVMYEQGYLAQITKPAGQMTELEVLAQAIVQRTGLTMTNILCALFPSVTTAVSDTGVDLTVDHIYDAMFSLNTALVPGPYHCVLYTSQINDLVSSLRGETGAMQWQQATADMLALKGPGYKGMWNGVNFWQSDSVGTVNGGADSSGCIFGEGAFAYTEADPSRLLDGMPRELAVTGSKVFAQFEQLTSTGSTRLTGHYFPAASIAENARAVEIITDR